MRILSLREELKPLQAHGISAWKALPLLLDCLTYTSGDIKARTPLCQQPWPWRQHPRQTWRCAQLLSGPAPSPGPCTPVWLEFANAMQACYSAHLTSILRETNAPIGPLSPSMPFAQQLFTRCAWRHLRSACSARDASCAVRVPEVPGRGGSPSLLGTRCSCAASSSSAADGQSSEAYTHQ